MTGVAQNSPTASLRLLIVSQYYWPENFRINDLAARLRARGHVVSVLTGLLFAGNLAPLRISMR
jgi:hypothetical protein